MFWTLIAPNKSQEQIENPSNVHIHAIILLLIIIDLFIVKTPIYFVAFVYNIVYGLVYILFTILLHVAGVTSKVYPFLNYETNPSLAAGIGLGIGFGGAIFGQSVQYGIFCLRMMLYRFCKNNSMIEAKPTVF